MIANLRDAKERLSELVKRAADGEEVVITVRGQPMARLSSAKSVTSGGEGNALWAEELKKKCQIRTPGSHQEHPAKRVGRTARRTLNHPGYGPVNLLGYLRPPETLRR